MPDVVWAEPERALRRLVYQRIAETGSAPANEELATRTGLSYDQVARSLLRLADRHALVLAPATTEIWMAHPFSGVPTPFAVRGRRRRYWANCAWDALAIPPLLELDAHIDAGCGCGDCGERLGFTFENGELVEGGGLVHFLVPPRRFWDNVGFT